MSRFDAVSDLIERRRLHEEGDVHLDRLEDEYVLFLGTLLPYGVAAFALPPLRGGEADPAHPAGVGSTARSAGDERRLAYAHEVGHLLLGHVGSLALKEFSAAWHEKQEAQAWAAAAMLLIPTELCLGGETVEEIAALLPGAGGLGRAASRARACAHGATGGVSEERKARLLALAVVLLLLPLLWWLAHDGVSAPYRFVRCGGNAKRPEGLHPTSGRFVCVVASVSLAR
jgi:hypothetical protein